MRLHVKSYAGHQNTTGQFELILQLVVVVREGSAAGTRRCMQETLLMLLAGIYFSQDSYLTSLLPVSPDFMESGP